MNIRRFAPADADAVVRVSELATRITSGKVYDQTFVEEMVEKQTRAYFLRRGEQMHFYVACEDDGTVIGCAAIGRPYRDDPAESCLYSVFVLPEKQNRGVGRALLVAAEEDALHAAHVFGGLGGRVGLELDLREGVHGHDQLFLGYPPVVVLGRLVDVHKLLGWIWL